MIKCTLKHTGKMQGFVSINTSSNNNKFCTAMAKTENICSKCYARKLEKYYSARSKSPIPNTIMSYKTNGDTLSSRKLNEVELLSIKKQIGDSKIVRFHAFGELINIQHLDNFIKIAEYMPDKTFTLWSKRKELIKKRYLTKPKNLIYMYSTLKFNVDKPIIPEGYDKCFTTYTKEYIEEKKIKINCAASCSDCLICYSKKGAKFIREKVK